MDIKNIDRAGEICRDLNLIKSAFSEMEVFNSGGDYPSDRRLVIECVDCQIEVNLSGIIERKEFLDMIVKATLIKKKALQEEAATL